MLGEVVPQMLHAVSPEPEAAHGLFDEIGAAVAARQLVAQERDDVGSRLTKSARVVRQDLETLWPPDGGAPDRRLFRRRGSGLPDLFIDGRDLNEVLDLAFEDVAEGSQRVHR